MVLLAPPPPRLELPPMAPPDPFSHPPATPPHPPAPPAPPAAPRPTLPTPPRSHRWAVLLVLAVVALVGIGGALAWYVRIKSKPPPLTPQQLFDQAFLTWDQLKSAHGEFSLTLSLEGNEGSELGKSLAEAGYRDRTATLTATASWDSALQPAPQGSGVMTLKTTLPPTVPLVGGAELTVKASFVQVDPTTVFLRFDELPSVPFVPLDAIKGQWVKLDLKNLPQQLPAPGGSPPPAAVPPEATLLEQQTKILELYRQHPFLVAERAEPGEVIDNAPTTKVAVTVNREQFTVFFRKVWDELVAKAAAEAGTPVDVPPEFDAMLQDLTETFQLTATFWIGTADHVIRRGQLNGSLSFKVGDVPQGTLSFTEEFTFSRLNQPVAITAPAQFLTMEEWLKQFQPEVSPAELPAEPGLPLDEGSAAPADSDGDQLPDQVEGLFGTDPNNPDTDGDGFTDGTEIENGYNPLGPGKLKATE